MPIFSRNWRHPQTNTPDPVQLRNVGPVLQIEISLPSVLAAQFTQQGRPLPSPETGFALIDTGASITGVDVDALARLGLSPFSTINVRTPQGQAVQGLFACQMSFPGSPILPQQFNAVAGSALAGQGYLALIGRDVLQSCQLVYNGPDGFWTIAF